MVLRSAGTVGSVKILRVYRCSLNMMALWWTTCRSWLVERRKKFRFLRAVCARGNGVRLIKIERITWWSFCLMFLVSHKLGI